MSIGVLDYFKFKKLVLESDVDIYDFFVEYSKYYVKSTNDFLTISKDFYSTMQSMKNKLHYQNSYEKNFFSINLRRFCASRHASLNPKEVLNGQTPFVCIVSNVISSKNKILDVGGGRIPYSSILMKDYFEKVGAIDKHFTLSEQALEKTGIAPIQGSFEKQTPIDDYDFVVGSRPCSAIRSIVENCKENNKGYVIKLCNCDLNSFENRNRSGYYNDWSEVLPDIDPSVKFYESGKIFLDNEKYAYNLDITQDQFAKIEEESRLKDISSLTNSVFGELNNYAQKHPVELPEELLEIY